MKAMFVGDPGDNFSGADTLTLWGETFKKGEWKTVTSNRFATHSHFVVDSDEDGESGPTEEQLKARLDELGVKYHPRAKAGKLAELLAEHEADKAERTEKLEADLAELREEGA